MCNLKDGRLLFKVRRRFFDSFIFCRQFFVAGLRLATTREQGKHQLYEYDEFVRNGNGGGGNFLGWDQAGRDRKWVFTLEAGTVDCSCDRSLSCRFVLDASRCPSPYDRSNID